MNPPRATGLNYDRDLLLTGAKRNAQLELWEVRRYGSDSFDDADHVTIFGLRPAEWYARGVRLIGRTAVECTRDRLATAIGAHVAAVLPRNISLQVVDLFAGSGNTLYWILRHLPGATGTGFELDAEVFRLTRSNLAHLNLNMDIRHVGYRQGIDGMKIGDDQWLVAFIAPPWGAACDAKRGLDLRRTSPPVIDIVDFLDQSYPRNRICCAIQIFEKTSAQSLRELESRFERFESRLCESDLPGRNHGLLVGVLRRSESVQMP